jgi:glycine C-acetyltransferase
MDGIVASLEKNQDFKADNDAMVMVDECHAVGLIGATGKGTPRPREQWEG